MWIYSQETFWPYQKARGMLFDSCANLVMGSGKSLAGEMPLLKLKAKCALAENSCITCNKK